MKSLYYEMRKSWLKPLAFILLIIFAGINFYRYYAINEMQAEQYNYYAEVKPLSDVYGGAISDEKTEKLNADLAYAEKLCSEFAPSDENVPPGQYFKQLFS